MEENTSEEVTVAPIYQFEYTDGTVRQTSDILHQHLVDSGVVESLARFGRRDPECTSVTVIGYSA